MSPRQIKLWGESILAAVGAGTQAPLLKRKQAQRLSDATLKRLDKLKEWRKQAARAMAVESDIVLPRQYLQSLAEQAPRSAVDLQAAMSGAPWRFAQFGAEILKVLED
jgi:ribonuclease D